MLTPAAVHLLAALLIERVHGDPGDDVVLAGDGDGYVWAGLGDDIIETGPGNDRAWGGEGADTFVVTGGSGELDVYDFAADADQVDLLSWGFTHVDDVMAAAAIWRGVVVLTFGEASGAGRPAGGPSGMPAALSVAGRLVAMVLRAFGRPLARHRDRRPETLPQPRRRRSTVSRVPWRQAVQPGG
ncbi:MAG: hypothetical protein LDL44_00985 [Caenispirillum sp.]|nr:hypothetical protein [Caenispirillum sp.]